MNDLSSMNLRVCLLLYIVSLVVLLDLLLSWLGSLASFSVSVACENIQELIEGFLYDPINRFIFQWRHVLMFIQY